MISRILAGDLYSTVEKIAVKIGFPNCQPLRALQPRQSPEAWVGLFQSSVSGAWHHHTHHRLPCALCGFAMAATVFFAACKQTTLGHLAEGSLPRTLSQLWVK